MQTLVLRKPLNRIPNLERMNLIRKYNSYRKLVNSGFFKDSALALVQFNSTEEFKLAEKYYQEI